MLRTRRPCALAFVCFTSIALFASLAEAQSGNSVHPTSPPQVAAVPRTAAISIDGRLDEANWAAAGAATDLIQSQPNEGKPATQRTEVRFLYDDEALYVGARMFDSLGGNGVRTRLVRRDRNADSDVLRLVFDTFHDHLGRSEFQINPSGVKGDATGPGGSDVDDSWDPVWEGEARIDSAGWTAELRIPFSQLRFSRDTVQTWGLQIVRLASRLNERTHWAFWPLKETGGPSRYGHLSGIRVISRPRRAEFLPYVVARSSYIRPSNSDDPFQHASEQSYRAGADLKYLLTSNLTLDASVNPDFGQVEVDPAVVNLSAFETFFPERRPFFVEGVGLFDFGSFSCYFCSNVSSLSLFYSRRIGRRPQSEDVAYNAGQYADVPENATILGAAKITGHTARGFSVGVLDAVTRDEKATVVGTDGERFKTVVEPLTNYFVGRLKKDFRGGDLVIGGIGTSVLRRLSDTALVHRLNDHSETAGLDMSYYWGKRAYNLLASAAVSSIAGDSNAIQRAQRSSARYFQRPDRVHGSNSVFSDRYDGSATSMRGYAAYARVAKISGDWLWEAHTNIRSPGFEANDLAFLTRADYTWMNANVFRQFLKPTKYYRNLFLIAGGQQQYNFDGDLTDRQLHSFLGGELANYWEFNLFYIRRPETFEDRLTRGGPVVKRPTNYTGFMNLSTDSRKRVVLATNPTYGRNVEGSFGYNYNLDVTVKPASNISFSLGPAFSRSSSTAQYVIARPDPTATLFYGSRYIFSDLVQRTLSMDTRLNVTFTPMLSLELFAQPFVSSASFTNFKEFDTPRALRKSVFGRDRGSIDLTSNPASCGLPTGASQRCVTLDPDGAGPAAPISFRHPDQNFRSLRGNAVLRWEYRPGSTMFLVWTQSRENLTALGNFEFSRDRSALFDAHPDNVFLIKVSYWLGL
ncbi:MAG: DUF5916 domain-containing protein [Gemmatimonadaceae bacterium]